MATTVIDVLGGGIFGLTVAYCLQKRGASVRIVEDQAIGAGASGGVVGALAPHTPDNWNDKKQFQFESLIAMPAFWADVDARSGLSSGYRQAGRLVALADKRELDLAHARAASAEHFWQGKASWNVITSGEYGTWEAHSPTGMFSLDTLSAHISPKAACDSLAKAFLSVGGKIEIGGMRNPKSDATVLCTGYRGLLDLSTELGCSFGSGVKGQGVLLGYNAGSVPHIFAEGLHFIPHVDGNVAIGSTSEKTWVAEHDTDHQLETIVEHAKRILPCLRDANVVKRWAGIRPKTARRTPILGAHPGQDRVFIANGGFKIGFGMAVKTGEVMADLILTGQADIPASFTVAANLK